VKERLKKYHRIKLFAWWGNSKAYGAGHSPHLDDHPLRPTAPPTPSNRDANGGEASPPDPLSIKWRGGVKIGAFEIGVSDLAPLSTCGGVFGEGLGVRESAAAPGVRKRRGQACHTHYARRGRTFDSAKTNFR